MSNHFRFAEVYPVFLDILQVFLELIYSGVVVSCMTRSALLCIVGVVAELWLKLIKHCNIYLKHLWKVVVRKHSHFVEIFEICKLSCRHCSSD